MTVFEALMIALTFGLLLVAMMNKSDKHNKK
ncbi:MAG: putative holin-like toxin [Clostridiales bacterium]|nr:putative holin-like toxin [Clostridiales bacterium]